VKSDLPETTETPNDERDQFQS